MILRCKRKWVVCRIAVFALFWIEILTGYCWSQTLGEAEVAKDGLSASLEIRAKEAILKWRFSSLQAPPIIDATLDDRPIAPSGVVPYSESGAADVILILIDVSDPARETQIRLAKLASIGIMSRAKKHQAIAIATYSDDLQLLTDRNRSIDSFTSALASVPPQLALPDLTKIILNAIDIVSLTPGERNAIFILTDGRSKKDLSIQSIVEAAKHNDIAVTFLLTSEHSPAKLDDLRRLASMTGGGFLLVDPSAKFLQGPLQLLDSGATYYYPLEARSRYFWQSDPVLVVTFHNGTRQFQIATEVPLPVLTPTQTVRNLAKSLTFQAAGGLLLTGLALGLVLLRRQRRTSSRFLSALPIFAFLRNADTGESFVLDETVMHVGRSKTNQIVLSDPSVSRVHAILIRDKPDRYRIENRSELNGTFVNDIAIEKADLADGDLIKLGSTTLRYSRVETNNSDTD